MFCVASFEIILTKIWINLVAKVFADPTLSDVSLHRSSRTSEHMAFEQHRNSVERMSLRYSILNFNVYPMSCARWGSSHGVVPYDLCQFVKFQRYHLSSGSVQPICMEAYSDFSDRITFLP